MKRELVEMVGELIKSVGFPIVASLGLGWVLYQHDQQSGEREAASVQSQQQLIEVTTATMGRQADAMQSIAQTLERLDRGQRTWTEQAASVHRELLSRQAEILQKLQGRATGAKR